MKWEKKKIKEFTTVITGGTPSTSVPGYWENGNIPWLNSGELNQEIITSCSNYITEVGLQNSSSRLMPPDTVLIALTGTTTGKTAYLTFEACANQSVTGILPSPFHNPKYLYYFLTSIRSIVLNEAYGGAQKHISQQYVKDIEVPLPPLHIQEQIADTLDKADALRRKDKELLQKYDQLAQSIFYDMFGDPVRNEKGWDVNLLGNLANVQTGPFGSLLHVSDYIIDGTPLVNPTHIVNKKIVPDNRYTITCEKLSSLQTYKLEKYDIIMGRRGEMGRCALVSEIEEGWLCGTGSIIIRPNQKSNPTFLLDLLTSKQMKNEMESNSKGTTMSNLNQSIVGKLPIITPPLKLQLLYQASLKKIAEQTVLIESSIN